MTEASASDTGERVQQAGASTELRIRTDAKAANIPRHRHKDVPGGELHGASSRPSALEELITCQEQIYTTPVDQLEEDPWISTISMLKLLIDQKNLWTARIMATGVLMDPTVSALLPLNRRHQITKLHALASIKDITSPQNFQELENFCNDLFWYEITTGNLFDGRGALILAYFLVHLHSQHFHWTLQDRTLIALKTMMESALGGEWDHAHSHLHGPSMKGFMTSCFLDWFENNYFGAVTNAEVFHIAQLAQQLSDRMRTPSYTPPDIAFLCSSFEDYLLERNGYACVSV